MLKSAQTLFLAFLVSFFFSVGGVAQSTNPFVGTWDINLSESDFGNATPPANMSRTYYDHRDDTYTYMVITTTQNGTLTGTTAHYAYDGTPYAIAGSNLGPTARIGYNKINDTTVEYAVYVDEVLVQLGTKFLSADQQQLTLSAQFPNSEQDNQVMVFDRRR